MFKGNQIEKNSRDINTLNSYITAQSNRITELEKKNKRLEQKVDTIHDSVRWVMDEIGLGFETCEDNVWNNHILTEKVKKLQLIIDSDKYEIKEVATPK